MTTFRSDPFDLTAGNGPGATDACFRAIGAASEAALLGCGLTRVSTTADWATATVPLVAGTYYAGYSVYRLGDAWSSTQEVYLKFEWGRGSTTASSTSAAYLMRITVGNDASFTVSATDYVCIGGTSTSLTIGNTFISSMSDGVLFFAFDDVSATSTSYGLTLCLERSCTPTGTVNTEAIFWSIMGSVNNSYAVSGTVAPIQRKITFSTNATAAVTPATSANYAVVGLNNNAFQLFPLIWGAKDKLYATRSYLTGSVSYITSNIEFSVDENSFPINYMSMRHAVATTTTGTSSGRVVFRWQ